MNKIHTLGSFILLFTFILSSCSKDFVVRKVANEVIEHTNYSVNDLKPNEKPSRYNEWMYQNFIIMEAMSNLGNVLGDERYKSFAKKNVDFFTSYISSVNRKNLKTASWYLNPQEMWHCGMIASFAQQQREFPDTEKLNGMNIFDSFLSTAPTLSDGTFVRYKSGFYDSKAVQIDDIYMVSPYWARLWKSTGKSSYLNKAIDETINYHHYLWDQDTQLMHCLWLEKKQATAAQYWGRGNGWFIMALTDLLQFVPADHPKRTQLLTILRQVASGLRKYQDKKGLWHQVINRKDSFSESSCSGMFTYCILKGVNEGWLDTSFVKTGLKGWKGLKTKLTVNYKIKDTCPPTDMSDDVNYYLNRPKITHDQHAIGPFLLAGAEVLKMKNRKTTIFKAEN